MVVICRFLKKAAVLCGLFLAITTIGWDLERSNGGYIKPVLSWILGYFMSFGSDLVKICETPLASLSIANIFTLLWHAFVGWFILSFGWNLISFGYTILSKVLAVFENDKKEETSD